MGTPLDSLWNGRKMKSGAGPATREESAEKGVSRRSGGFPASGRPVPVGRTSEGSRDLGTGRRCAMLKKNPLSLAKTEPASALTPFEEFERRFEDFIRRPSP